MRGWRFPPSLPVCERPQPGSDVRLLAGCIVVASLRLRRLAAGRLPAELPWPLLWRHRRPMSQACCYTRERERESLAGAHRRAGRGRAAMGAVHVRQCRGLLHQRRRLVAPPHRPLQHAEVPQRRDVRAPLPRKIRSDPRRRGISEQLQHRGSKPLGYERARRLTDAVTACSIAWDASAIRPPRASSWP